jgi:hypothetical protein
MLKHVVFALGASIAGAGSVAAFEVNGYRMGMAAEDVRRMATAGGARWEPFVGETGPMESFAAWRGDAPEGSFSFCRGRLTHYSFNVAGGLAAFVRLAERQMLTAGAASSQAYTSETALGPVPVLVLEWTAPGWKHTLTLLEHQGRQTASRSWSSTARCG